MNSKLKCVFMGTPQFCIPTLKYLSQDDRIEIKAVVTMPDRPAGRGQQLQSPPVAIFAKENNLRLFQTENINKSSEFLSFCENEKIDFILVLSFAQFLGNKILSIAKFGCFNIHTSLLPKYRGAAPIHYALKNGDSETGVTIQRMVKQMDAGDICVEEKLAINPQDDISTLFDKLSNLCPNSTKKLIDGLIATNLNYRTQNHDLVSFAPEFNKDAGKVDFAFLSAVEIYNLFRAFKLWPGLFYFHEKARIKLVEIKLYDSNKTHGKPGTCFFKDDSLLISTKKGIIEVAQLQMEGKKAITAIDFRNLLKSRNLPLEFTIDGVEK